MIIKLGGKRWRFKTSFDEFTLEDIKRWMPSYSRALEIEDELLESAKRYDAVTELIDLGLNELADDEQMQIDVDVNLLYSEQVAKLIEMLSVLCYSKSFNSFAQNSNDVNRLLLKDCVNILLVKVGDFTDYWNECKPVESFKHNKKGFLSIAKAYKVHDMDRNTLMRDALASYQAATALTNKNELDSGSWDNICSFVATLVRPSKQVNEIAYSNDSFIHASKLKGMSFSDKESYYKQKIENEVRKLEKRFVNLKLPIAIGVLKEYFKKKR